MEFTKHLLIFDGHALAFTSWFTSDPNKVPPGFFARFNNAIERYQPTRTIVTFDPPPPTFRHDIYPQYKAQRPPVPERLLQECEEVRTTLEVMEIPHVTIQGYEADDVIASLTSDAQANATRVTIVTSDLDLLQLVSGTVQVEVFSQYWPTRVFDETTARARFNGIDPSSIPDYKALCGDKSDNLPGIPGIGHVAAIGLLSKYKTLSGVYKNIDAVPSLPVRGAKRIHGLLLQHEDLAAKMLKLTTVVRDIPLTDVQIF